MFETIYSLSENKRSGPMQLSSFKWGENENYWGSEYIGIDAQLTKYSCPFYTDIHNCLANTRSKQYENSIEKQTNPLVFNWISLSFPIDWQIDWQSEYKTNLITSKNISCSIAISDSMKYLLDNLSSCYNLEFKKTENDQNNNSYKISKYYLKKIRKNCEEESLPSCIIQIQHGEFKDGVLLLSIKPLNNGIIEKKINEDTSLLLESLKKSVLY